MTFPPREIRTRAARYLGKKLWIFDELPSTNTAAVEIATRTTESVAVLADFQTAGRGRYGRVWHAPPGSSLLLSVTVDPPAVLGRPVILTALTTLAVSETVYALTGRSCQVKWPNDLLVHDRKLCGVLIEKTTTTVIGVGLNLNQTARELAADGLTTAISLRELTEQTYTPDSVAELVLAKLDATYGRLLEGSMTTIEADWGRLLGNLSGFVTVVCHDDSVLCGRLRAIGFDGIDLEVAGRVRRLVPEAIRHLWPS